mgnify:FL=1
MFMKNKNLFRKNLVARRKALGLTQEQLAVRMNVSPQSVSKWENTGYPDPELLPQLARALNTSIDVLFGMKNPESNVDLPQLIHDAIHSAKPENRSQLIMELCYAMICAYDPNGDTAGHLRQCFEREIFAAVKTDLEIAMARLNPDLRYFFFLEKPENGVNSYFTNPQNMARLLRTLMRMPFASSAIWVAVCATRCMQPPLLPSGFPFLLTRCSPSLTGLTDSDWSGGSVWMPRRV